MSKRPGCIPGIPLRFSPISHQAEILEELKSVTRTLGLALGVRGLMNVQFAEKDGLLYVLEVIPEHPEQFPSLPKQPACLWCNTQCE